MASPVVPLLIAAGIAAAVSAGLALNNARARQRLERIRATWKAHAAGHGMRFVPSAADLAPYLDPQSPGLRAEVHGVEIDASVLTEQKTTRVEAALPSVDSTFRVVFVKRGEEAPAGLVDAPTGNKAFDAAYGLFTNDADLARSILDRRLAHLVLSFPRKEAKLEAAGNRFVLSWPGVETDLVALDAGLSLVSQACRRRA